MNKLINKRFKMLALLAISLGIWDDQIEELAIKFDEGHSDAEKALSFYEDAIIGFIEDKMNEDGINLPF